MGKHPAKCPKCGGRVDFDSAVGDHVVCASCQARLKVPATAKSHYPTGSPTLTGQASAAADPLIGTTLGEFEIVELLGRGGMGAVYKARQASLGRLVAIKVLPQSLASDESFIERFDREARSAAAVRHPNIIEIFAVGEDRGYQYIAMEFIDGDTLSDILKREGRLAPARAVEIMRAVASALAEAHECGILHRDIKPSNILIDAKGRVKVADFGLAKHEGVDVSVTVTGQALGTPLYMPPEAARGERFDARSDLYSLGATFYHALAGKPPFDGQTPAQLILKHAEARVPPLQEVLASAAADEAARTTRSPQVPVALCRAIHRLLRKNPAERYDSADKLLEVLARIETGLRAEESTPTQSVSVRPATARQRPPTRRKDTAHRRKAAQREQDVGGASLPRVLPKWLLGAAGALLLVLVLVLVLVLSSSSKRPTAVAPPPSPEPGTRNLQPGPPAAVAERNAEIVLRNVQVCIKRNDYTKAQTWLAKLRSDYGSTNFAAAHRADIAALQQQIDAYVKGTARPQPPKPTTEHPAPPPPRPPKPVPPPDDNERWTEWEDLFDGKTLDGWKVVEKGHFAKGGKVSVTDGRIVLDQGAPYTGIAWTRTFATAGYEVAIEAMRVAGQNEFCSVTFPVGSAGCTLMVGGYNNAIVGLGNVDGRRPNANPTTHPLGVENQRWYRIRLRVAQSRVQAWIDSDRVIDFATAGHQLSVHADLEPLRPFGLNSHTATGAIRSIRLRRLKPEAEQARPIYAGPWIVHPDPVLAPGQAGAWDEGTVQHPCVIKVGDGYLMYYLGGRESRFQTGLATSKDLVHWTKHPGNPILRAEEGRCDFPYAAGAKVLEDAGLFRMYYGAWRTVPVCYAESRDGIRWSRPSLGLFDHQGSKANNICLVRGGPGQWDSVYLSTPQVIRVGGVYHLYYSGTRNDPSYTIGHATSSDGVRWSKDPANPVLSPGGHGEWDGFSVRSAWVAHRDGEFQMFYSGESSAAKNVFGIGLATSTDGVRWRKWAGNPVLDRLPPGSWQGHSLSVPCLYEDATGSFLFFTGVAKGGGSAIGFAKLDRPRAAAPAQPWRVYTQWPFDAAEAKRRQSETAKALGVEVEQDIDLGNGVTMTLVLIPAGEFLMGSPEKPSIAELVKLYGGKAEEYERERPQHRVRIPKPFWLGKHEIAQRQWEGVTGGNPSFFKSPEKPVDSVSWDDCQAFLKKANARLQGSRIRLPTEAEWEYACRAGAQTQFHFGDDPARLGDYEWYQANSHVGSRPTGQWDTHPGGRRKPNPWGLHDMGGSLQEWCEDDWHGTYQGAPTDGSAWLQHVGAGVRRGGSWFNGTSDCRSAARRAGVRGRRDSYYGLRVVLVPELPVAPEAPPRPTRQEETRPAAPASEADTVVAKQLEPIEAKVAAWDFAGAAAELAKLKVEDKALAERVARRREEVGRMAALKAKMIERVNTSKPRLTKRSLGIPGIGADLVKADEQGITTAKLPTGKAETFAWRDLKPDAVRRLVGYTAKSADDHLAAGILLLQCSRHAPRDGIPHAAREDYTAAVQAAEEHFAKAKAGGVAIDRYLDPLAEAAFAGAKALLEETRGVGTPRPQAKLAAAQAALAAIEKEYGRTAWLAAHKDEVAAAREAAKAGIAEAEAEELYRQAAKLAKEKDLWALKPIIDKLKADYAATKAVTDAARKPSFAEMAESVAKLGKFLTVRKDGKGDFKTIQAAIDAAPPNSLIEVTDNGVYSEGLVLATDGITLRGRPPHLPVVLSSPRAAPREVLVEVGAPRVSIARLALVHATPAARGAACVRYRGAACRLSAVLVYVRSHVQNQANRFALTGDRDAQLSVDNAVVLGRVFPGVNLPGKLSMTNCLCSLGPGRGEGPSVVRTDDTDCELHRCTMRYNRKLCIA